MKISSRIGFTLFIVALFAWAVANAFTWGFKAGIFPLVITIPALGMALLQLVFDLSEAKGHRKEQKDASPDLKFEEAVDPATARKRALTTIAWIVGFMIAIQLFGIYISAISFVFLYLKVQSRERWLISISMTVFCGLFVYGLFDRLLHVPFPPGIVIDLFR